MAFKDISDPAAVEKAIEEYDELGRDNFLAKYGFRPALEYYIEWNGSLYDSKAILGRAHGIQFPERGNLRSEDFSGGKQVVGPKLAELGFTLVSDPPAPTVILEDDARPVGELINEVLELQHSYSDANTPAMQERGLLIRKELPKAIRWLLPEPGTLPFDPQVEGKDAMGKKARVPWVRVYSETQSPSAMKGWYVALLFAADGSRAYLSLATGTSTMETGTFKLQSPARVAARVAWAREHLATADTTGLSTSIELADPGNLGPQYERGTVFTYELPAGEDHDESELAEKLQRLLVLLSELYSSTPPDDEDEAAATTRPAHLLLKWNSTADPDTIEKHIATAEANGGYVWWGSWTGGSRRTSSARVSEIRRQLADGVKTYAYLYRLGPSPAAWRASVHDFTNQRSEVDEQRVPSYYAPNQQHTCYALLSDIQPVSVDWMNENLALQKNPIPGSLLDAYKNQTSPMYVVDLHHGPEQTDDGEIATTLTKAWLQEQTLWTDEQLDELLEVLLSPKPQVILAGPPGTGKSWVAQAVARYLTRDRSTHWRLVQFHPSYGYENFIEGLHPVADRGAITFKRVDGTVLRMAKAARLGDLPYVLILDEMNRANIPRVLGELMFLFEYRDQIIDLQYSQGFSLPKNLCFIATMNTADRSIRSIDVALRRRFEIFECLPDSDALRAFYDKGQGTNYVPDLVAGFEALNAALTEELDRHHTIGQSFFMAPELTAARLKRVWSRQIFPLIEEYFFDQPDRAATFTATKFWPSLDA